MTVDNFKCLLALKVNFSALLYSTTSFIFIVIQSWLALEHIRNTKEIPGNQTILNFLYLRYQNLLLRTLLMQRNCLNCQNVVARFLAWSVDSIQLIFRWGKINECENRLKHWIIFIKVQTNPMLRILTSQHINDRSCRVNEYWVWPGHQHTKHSLFQVRKNK